MPGDTSGATDDRRRRQSSLRADHARGLHLRDSLRDHRLADQEPVRQRGVVVGSRWAHDRWSRLLLGGQDRHESCRMTRLVQRLVFAQIMDAATFVAFFLLIPISVHVERNPLIGVLYAMGGFALVASIKVFVALIVGWRTLHTPLKHPRLVTVLMS